MAVEVTGLVLAATGVAVSAYLLLRGRPRPEPVPAGEEAGLLSAQQ